MKISKRNKGCVLCKQPFNAGVHYIVRDETTEIGCIRSTLRTTGMLETPMFFPYPNKKPFYTTSFIGFRRSNSLEAAVYLNISTRGENKTV